MNILFCELFFSLIAIEYFKWEKYPDVTKFSECIAEYILKEYFGCFGSNICLTAPFKTLLMV